MVCDLLAEIAVNQSNQSSPPMKFRMPTILLQNDSRRSIGAEIWRWAELLLSLTVLLCMLGFLLYAPFTAHRITTTTQPTVSIRDCDAKVDTTITVAQGGTVLTTALPKNWTLDFNFGGPVKAVFTVDGTAPKANQYWAAPYCPAGHDTPLNLAVGTHTIDVTVNGNAITPLVFTIALPPPVVAPTQQIAGPPATFGTNLIGANWPQCDPALHPQLLAAIKSCGFQYVRMWLENDALAKAGDSYWTIARAYRAAGVQTVLEVQYQYNAPALSVYSDAAAAALAAKIPANAISYVCWGNECNTAAYFSGSQGQLVHELSVVVPIHHAAGVKVLAPSALNDLGWEKDFAAAGAWKLCDGADYHCYTGSSTGLVSDAQQWQALCQANGTSAWMTEFGRRQNKGETIARWTAGQQQVLAGLKPISVNALQFSLIPTGDALDDPLSVLTAAYGANTLVIYQTK
jgi:hypothetical protein